MNINLKQNTSQAKGFILLSFLCLFSFNANAKLIIKGNERVDNETIYSLIAIKQDANASNISKAQIDSKLKALIESSLFFDVKISKENNNQDLIINLKENPIISEVKIVGNKKIKDDALENELLLKKRGIYTKFKLQSDLKRINEIYVKSGRFLTKIEPKLIQNSQNRVEVIFDIKEGPQAKIEDIIFVGNKAFSDSELISQITTKPSRWYRFFSSSDIYDSDRVAFDQEKLRLFYGSMGYADFSTISGNAQITRSKDKFLITFLVEEGIKYDFGEIKIINQIEKFDESILKETILIQEGKTYNSDLIKQTIDKMIAIMSENSYAFADIDPVLQRDKERKIIDISFVIRQSPRVYIDHIVIKGNTRTQDKVLRRELRIKDGDPYNITKINRSKQRLQNLGFFESVEFNTKRVGDTDKVILEINVKERKTGELNFGVGYSTVDEATANIGLKERNFLGTGRELGVNIQRSQFNLSGNISYSKPYFMDRPIEVGTNLFAFESDSRNTLVYSQKSHGFSVNGIYAISEYLGHKVSYSLRDESIFNVLDTAAVTIQQLEGDFASSSVGHTLSYDKRDSRINPTEGYYFTISQEYTGIGGDIKTFKNTGSVGFYQPIVNKDFVLKLLARGGVIDGLGQDVRNNLGFFLGGNNFRGFEFAGLGPRAIGPDGSAVGGNAVGGNIYYVATAEFRFPLGLPKELGIQGIIFSDNGTVKSVDAKTSNATQIADVGSLRSTYGFSVAWSSPLGPIRFDFSQIARSEEFDRTQTFQFNFGSTF